MKKFFIFLISLMLTGGSGLFAQLTTTSGLTPTQYVQDVLLGAGVTAFNISYTGNANAISRFTYGSPSVLGFGSGLLMSTGKAVTGTNGPQGPNSTSANNISTGFNLPGDQDLATIAGEPLSNLEDAVVLEFDFIPQSDSVKFNYIFSSEEYNEYVHTDYNDIFAFILSGVTTSLPATNIAIVPGTNPAQAVAIGNINNGENIPSDGMPYAENPQFFRDNYFGTINVAYDGLTKVLTARHAVICGETYHIKLVIADVGDGSLDSGVFLEAGSFSSSAPFQIISAGTSMGPVGSATTIYENCGYLSLMFTRPEGNVGVADTLALSISGNAINGSDYYGLSDTIFFAVGVDTVINQIYAVNDGFGDAGDSIYIFYTYTNPCNVVDTVELTLKIMENAVPLMMPYLNDTILCQGQTATFTANVFGSVATPYSYTWTNQSSSVVSTGPSFNAPSITQEYYFAATDACGHYSVYDTMRVTVNPILYVSGSIDVIGSPNDSVMTEGCGSAKLIFVEHGTGAGTGNNNYSITITGNIENDGSDLGVSIPTTINFNGNDTVIYNLTAIVDGLVEGSESITITIDYNNNQCIPVNGQAIKTLTIKDPVPFSIDLTEDTTICKGRSLPLKAVTTGGGGTISYWWDHTASTSPNIAVIPTVTDTFYVTSTETCNHDTVRDSIIVTVLYNPPVVTSLSVDTVCMGENYEFNTVVVSGTGIGAVTGSWLSGYPGDLQSNGTTNSWIIYGVAESGTYIYSVKDQCNVPDWDTLHLIAKDCTPVIPNIITCNGDNINEVWTIKNLDENPGTAVTILDRWGKPVYSSSSYDNKWSPKDLHDGVYFYIVEPKKRDKQSGFLHILNKK